MSSIHLPNPKKMPDKVTQKKAKRNTVIFLRKDYSQEALLQIIESRVEEKLLRKSDLVIWSSVMINIVQQKAMTLNGKQGVSIDIYRVIDSLKGSDNPDFKKLEDNSLVIEKKMIGKNYAVVKGYFTKFLWNDTEFEAMHFTTILTFNEFGKITKQVDWINYPANLVNYNERGNSNHWIR